MLRNRSKSAFALLIAAAVLGGSYSVLKADARPVLPELRKGEQSIVFAGGCFWGIQEVFEHVKGVTSAISGYAGGKVASPTYEQVSSGSSGHAESVKVTFDTSVVSLQTLLDVFFTVAHDPTQLDRQGPDIGPQYRSAIMYDGDAQKRVVEAYIKRLTDEHRYPRPIVTQVVPLKGFYAAEEYHQHYAARHPDQPYIRIYDLPKVEALKEKFPQLYKEPSSSQH
jgi:peptide-methionine (S)-S-oxide reductase